MEALSSLSVTPVGPMAVVISRDSCPPAVPGVYGTTDVLPPLTPSSSRAARAASDASTVNLTTEFTSVDGDG